MDRKVFIALLLALIVVGLVTLTFLIFKPFMLALLWSAALAIISHRAYERLSRWLKGRRSLAAFLMTLLVLFLILGPFFSLSIYFFEDAGRLAQDLRSGSLKSALDHPWVKSAIEWAEHYTGEKIDAARVRGFFVEHVAEPLARGLTDALAFLGSLLAGIAFVALSIFYFYRDGPALVRVLRELLPLSDEDREEIFDDIGGAVNAAIRGGLVTAFAQGLLGFVIIYILGVERPLVWAVVMALASFVPLIGTALVWVPMAGLLALNGEVGKAVILCAYGVGIIAMSDNLLRPVLVGQHMEAHPLLLFFGILGGIGLFGFAGIILGPVAVAFLNVTTRLFRREFARSGAPEPAGSG